MNSLFIDACHFIALINSKDELHKKALSVEQTLSGCSFVTSDLVLTEILNAFASKGTKFREMAVKLIQTLQSRPDVYIEPMTRDQFQEALDFYERRNDKAWSLIDCASFVIMQKRNIRDALTYDHHFQQAGFTALLRSTA